MLPAHLQTEYGCPSEVQVFTFILLWDLAPPLGNDIYNNSSFSSNKTHILVPLLNTCMAYIILINGRLKKATYGQIQGDYE
jgi:hypothetical protein